MSMQMVSWVNPRQQVLPVKFWLKSDRPATGVERKNVENAVAFNKNVHGKNAVFPPDSTLIVLRDEDTKKMSGLVTIKNPQSGKLDILELDTDIKDEEKGLYKITANVGRYFSGQPIVKFAGKKPAPVKAPTPGLSLLA